MDKKEKIPVYGMEDWFSGMYIKPMTVEKTGWLAYERSEPHRHDFYYMVLLDEGEMAMEVDFQTVEITDRTLFLSFPGQIHSISSANLSRGWFLAFDPGILDEQLKDVLDQCLAEIMLVNLTREQSTQLNGFINHLYLIYNDTVQLFRPNILNSMITAFVYEFAGKYFNLERSGLSNHSARSIEIATKFRQQLRQNFRTVRKASAYAERMHMTLSHLNDTVKAVTGFNVTYHIQQELMREARRLISYGDRSIREVSFELGFDDEKYFSRLFKKVIGVAPGVYRQRI